MFRSRTAFGVLVGGSALAIGACHDDSPITGPSPGPEIAELRQEAQGVGLDPLLAHARHIPGFGGFFLDRDGQPTVYLKDARQRGTAEAGLAGTLRELGMTSSQLRILKGNFDYLQLNDWFTRAAPAALAIPGAVFADLDEGSNRLRLGVETAAAERSVRELLARHGIPSAAAVVERAEPIRYAATLRNKVTPRVGGLQINFGNFICTLGFNTRAGFGLVIIRSFITNSHCTTVQGGVEGTQYHQPLAPNLIGTEVADPAYFTGFPCPSGRKCRFSDAARARYANGVGSDLGGIARTMFRALGFGSITINAANPVLNITAEAGPVQGAEVNKIGRTTGWTYGKILATCIAVNVSNTNVTQLCQSRTTNQAAGVVGSGDSGSPVFYWRGRSNVTLIGLLWGGNAAGTFFVFSPMSGIESELGPLTTF